MYPKIELLAPVGNLEKLEIAIKYGADAVYLSGRNFNLRNFSDNFSIKKMYLARKITSKKNIKMYLAINTFIRNKEIPSIKKYIQKIKNIKPDAVIIADPAIFLLIKKFIPNIPIHISTQFNTTNYYTVMFWDKLGAKRINLARELNLTEIQEIILKSNIEIETFVHGAMCMSYSGRCLLSNFITMRGSNQGKCCQACRFKYTVTEKKSSTENLPIYEDKAFSYLFSSKDLCMLNYIPSLISAGVNSLKIEGRMKSSNYLACITKIYRQAIDYFYNEINCDEISLLKTWHNHLHAVSNRGYSTGFFLNDPEKKISNLNKKIDKKLTFIGKVVKTSTNGATFINVKNKIFLKDRIKIISTSSLLDRYSKIHKIFDKNKKACNYAQPGSSVYIFINIKCYKSDIIQKIETIKIKKANSSKK